MTQLPGRLRVTKESTTMYHLRVPQTAEELESYYQFRWEMLRKPLHQPKGSERDAWDAMAHHQMVVDEEGNLVAVGRQPTEFIFQDSSASLGAGFGSALLTSFFSESLRILAERISEGD